MPQYVQPGNLARLGVITSILALGACLGGGGGGGSSSSEPSTRFSATIERTTYGIPHITADDYAGAGYGHGYAIAEDNLCVLADAFITYRGERSQYFGPDAPASLASTFGSPPNLEADFFFRFIVNDEAVTRFRDDQTQDVRDLVSGFTAGYNRYVREILDDGHAGRHADCRNQPWLAEISEDDLMRRLIALNLFHPVRQTGWKRLPAPSHRPSALPASECAAAARRHWISTRSASSWAARKASAATFSPSAATPPKPAGACCWPTPTGTRSASTVSTRFT